MDSGAKHMTIKFGTKAPLPPQAQQPILNRTPKRMEASYPDGVIAEWVRVAARCPHSDSNLVMRWIQSQPIFLSYPVIDLIEKSGVMFRTMPDDFINAIFEVNSHARRALDEFLVVLRHSRKVDLLTEEGALVIKVGNLTASVRPARDGIFVAMAVPSEIGPSAKVRSEIHKIKSGIDFPSSLISALNKAA